MYMYVCRYVCVCVCVRVCVVENELIKINLRVGAYPKNTSLHHNYFDYEYNKNNNNSVITILK